MVEKKSKEKKLGEIPYVENIKDFLKEPKEKIEKTEKITDGEIQKLREKIEKTDLDDRLKTQAAAQAQSIKSLQDSKKIKKLLEIAKNKGIVYAVNVAKKVNDPYILDTLHDALANKGYYKEFLK